MKRILYLVFVIFLFVSCESPLYQDYILTKKYPLTIPELELKVLSDTTGVITKKEDDTAGQSFEFVKRKTNYLIVTNIDSINNLVSFKKGDTVVYHRKELYLINEKHKLVFTKKE